jgi:molecular chaperone DnaK
MRTSSPRIRKTVGIDLGTTNSVIAVLDPTDSALITGQDEAGHRTFPSLVGYHPTQQRLVAGRAAQALPGGAHTLPLASVKRFMGLDRRFPLGPERLTPQEASAAILRLLRDVLADTLGSRQSVDSAVITMPAYFNHNQIEATRAAGELADFEVVELLHEPTAAAIYYSWALGHRDATYLVYDLGGGTFDVSVIRRRLDDYEVLSVSGDPFLGGDDFDRLLASYLLEAGTWTWHDQRGPSSARRHLDDLFDISTARGAVHFALLVRLAESIKCELTGAERVQRSVPQFLRDSEGRWLALEAAVERAAFSRLIKTKIDRTIECCHEALAQVRERAGLRLADVDHVVLVGGSSRVPLVRETVRAAFCNADLPEHVRSLDPLLHEPDLCVAYGAALRAATHGTRYLFSPESGVSSPESEDESPEVELHLTSPANTRDTRYQATGVVRVRSSPDVAAFAKNAGRPLTPDPSLEGGSVRIRSLATGLAEEAFLDERGSFLQELELRPECDNALEWTVCDGAGTEVARVVTAVRHQGEGRPLGQAVLPTQIITKPLQIEVIGRGGQRVKQVVAPVGATLPGVFSCICRTHDQAGRIVVPIFEENRIVKQMVLDNLDPDLPVGSPVEVEFTIDVKHAISVTVRVREGDREHSQTASIEAPPPPGCPTREQIDLVRSAIEELLPRFRGAFRARMKARAEQLHQDLLEALRYEDEPRAIQRFAELKELCQQLESNRDSMLDPPWPRFEQLVRQCLELADDVADRTGRDREELFEHVRTQEQYAEQAYEEENQPLYRECRENLEKYAGYLTQLLQDSLPRPAARPDLSPEEEARTLVERFRAFLSAVWKEVRSRGRPELEARLAEIASQARGFSQRIKTEPQDVIRDARRLGTEVEKVAGQLEGRKQTPGDDAGLLEGSP